MDTVYQENIRMDDIDAILAKMNQFNDYEEVTKSTAPFTNVLTVSPEEKGVITQKKYAISQSQELGFFDDMPPALIGQMATVYRDVFYKNTINILVQLTELYPVAGRIWTNVYNVGNWTGWACVLPQNGDNILWNDGIIKFADNASFNLRRTIAGYSHVRITYYVQTNVSFKPEQSWNTAVVPVVNGNVVRCTLEGTQYLYHLFLGLEIVNSTLYTTFGRRYNLSNSTLEENYGNQTFITKIEGVNL